MVGYGMKSLEKLIIFMVKKVDRPRDVMDTWCPCTESIVGIKKDKISVEFATIVFFQEFLKSNGNECKKSRACATG